MSESDDITIDEVRHLALLTRINMTDHEIEEMRDQMIVEIREEMKAEMRK